jgi:phage repressor protein C with HTH and peptisase S24 domain
MSRSLGKNHAYLHQYIFDGKPQYLPEAERIKLAEYTGLTNEQLGVRTLVYFGGKKIPEVLHEAFLPKQALRPYDGPSLERNADKIPVYAAAMGGAGHLIITFDPIEDLAPPPELLSVKGAYGILITGESMVPAYRPGETAWVHPHLRPIRESDVVLYHVPPHGEAEAIVKTLVTWNSENWTLRQYNPAKEWTESRIDWPVCHRIIGKRNVR